MKHLVFFASGSGTNFQSVIDAVQSGMIDARICGLIVNRRDIGAAKRAAKHGIPVQSVSPGSANYTSQLLDFLEVWEPDLIVLAGYMFKIPLEVIQTYARQIINIHPSLLPKYGGKGYYGLNVHKAVLAAHETQSGCSVHVVTEEYDEGPVIGQRTVPVLDSDTPKTLAARVLEKEHELLPEVIQNYLPKL